MEDDQPCRAPTLVMRPTEEMVRRYFDLPARSPGEPAPLRSESFVVPIGAAGGLEAHRAALVRYMRRLERAEIGHAISMGIAGLRSVRVIIRVHWAMGAWVQVLDFEDVFGSDQENALFEARFGVTPSIEVAFAGAVRGFDWEQGAETETEADWRSVADRALMIWPLLGITDDQELNIAVEPVTCDWTGQMLTIQRWIDDICDDELAAEIIVAST